MRSVREEPMFPVYPQHQIAAPMMPTVQMLAAATGGRYSAFDERPPANGTPKPRPAASARAATKPAPAKPEP
jgi:hypothetical protein